MSGQCSITSSRSSSGDLPVAQQLPERLGQGAVPHPPQIELVGLEAAAAQVGDVGGVDLDADVLEAQIGQRLGHRADPAAEVERDAAPGRAAPRPATPRARTGVAGWKSGCRGRSPLGVCSTGCSAMRSSEPVGRVVAADELRHALGAFDRLRQRAVGGPLPVGVQRLPVGPGGLLGQELRRLGRQVWLSPSGGTAAGGRAPPSTARWAGARRRPPPGACRGRPGRRARGPCASRPGAASRTGRRRRSTSGTGRRRSDRPARMRSAGPSSPSLTPSSCRRWPGRRTSACSQGIWRASAAATPGSPKGWRSRSNIRGSGKASGLSTQKNGPSPLRASRFEPPPEPRFCPKWS